MIALLLAWTLKLADTNTHAATARGVKQFNAKQYAAAASSFETATSAASTPARQFNLGTARVAAGDRERGAAALDKAMADPQLRADALYNRGTSALAAKAYDSAIRDYVETLKLRPNDAAAKRNLEIAHVLKRAAEQKSGGGNQKGPKGPQPQPRASEKPQEKGDTDADALLRSVQQQEKEELERMHRARGERTHVGW